MIACIAVLIGAYIGPCEYNFGRCIGGNSILLIRTMFHFSLALLIVSPLLFFISGSIFFKWLRFAIVWFVLAVMFIILSPEYQGGWLGIGPEKESVSILMSVLFAIISIAKISWDIWKAKRHKVGN